MTLPLGPVQYLEMLAEEKQKEDEILRQLEIQDARKHQATQASSSNSSSSGSKKQSSSGGGSGSSSKGSKSATAILDTPSSGLRGVELMHPLPNSLHFAVWLRVECARFSLQNTCVVGNVCASSQSYVGEGPAHTRGAHACCGSSSPASVQCMTW